MDAWISSYGVVEKIGEDMGKGREKTQSMDFNRNQEASLLDHLCQCFSNISMYRNYMGEPIKTEIAGVHPQNC